MPRRTWNAASVAVGRPPLCCMPALALGGGLLACDHGKTTNKIRAPLAYKPKTCCRRPYTRTVHEPIQVIHTPTTERAHGSGDRFNLRAHARKPRAIHRLREHGRSGIITITDDLRVSMPPSPNAKQRGKSGVFSMLTAGVR